MATQPPVTPEEREIIERMPTDVPSLDALIHSRNAHVRGYAWAALSATRSEYAAANMVILRRRMLEGSL